MVSSDILVFLGSQPIFRDIPGKDLTPLAFNCVIRKIESGQFLYRAWDAARYVWLVRQGIVQTSIQSPTGKVLTLEVFKSGDIFGSYACQDTGRYSYDVSGLVHSEVIGISNKTFDVLLERSTKACATMLRSHALRMRDIMLLRAAVNERADRRVCAVLLWIHQRLGKNIPMTRSMVGTMTGLSVETVSRVMSPMAKKGWISSRRRQILIERLDMLHDFLS